MYRVLVRRMPDAVAMASQTLPTQHDALWAAVAVMGELRDRGYTRTRNTARLRWELTGADGACVEVRVTKNPSA